jgi:carboxypeptidase D
LQINVLIRTGALLYDPCIGAFDAQDAMYTLPFIEQNNNVLGYNESFLSDMRELDESCGHAAFREAYMHFPPNGTQPPLPEPGAKCNLWETAYDAAYATNPCFNVYMVGFTCPLLADPLGYPTDLQFSYPGQPVYFNRTDVKRAMHAPMDVEWLECKGPVFVGDDGPEGYNDESPDPIQGVLPRVIEATNRVLM